MARSLLRRSSLALALTVIALAGCSGDDDEGATPPPAPSAEETAPNHSTSEQPMTPPSAPAAFEIDAPNDVIVRAGATATFAVTTNAGVAIAIDDLPPGVTAMIAGANVTVSAAADAGQGDHAIVVRGDAGGSTKKITRTIIVAGKPGSPDPTFGDKGTLIGLKAPIASTSLDGAGNLYVGGAIPLAMSVAMVSRYLPNGAPDMTYGQNGYTTFTPTAGSTADARVVARTDGSAVVLMTSFPTAVTAESCVTKIDAKGAIDTTFGTNGWSCLAQPAAKVYSRMLRVLSDGTILRGSTKNGGDTTVYIDKLTAQGKRDESFGKAGFIEFPVSVSLAIAGMEVDSQGRIIVVLEKEWGGGYMHTAYRFTSGGQPDLYFNQLGTPGKVDMNFEGGSTVRATAIGPNDEIFVTGSSFNMLLIGGVDAKGAPLTSFGAKGWRSHAPFTTALGLGLSFDGGKLVASASSFVEGVSRSSFIRLDASTGDLDASFGTNGADYIPSSTLYGITSPLARRGRLTVTSGTLAGTEPFIIKRVWQ